MYKKRKIQNKVGNIINSANMYEKFISVYDQEYYVDKSNIINEFNKLIGKDSRKYVCITKPRRFGKTSIAALLVTYYSKGINSKKIFDKFKVSKGKSLNEETKKEEIKQYKQFQGKYHTLYFDFSYNVNLYKTLNEYLASINEALKEDIKKFYPNSELVNDFSDIINVNLKKLFMETGEKFIIIIDEWDYIMVNDKFSFNEKNDYITFLKDLIKDKSYLAFAYITGILPIAKELSQSTLNCFKEYSILEDNKYYQYFGFTEQEVRDLCNKNNILKYEDLKSWYNGYKAYNGERIFNTWSVINALEENTLGNYWTKTGRLDELVNVINFNILGVKDEILDLIKEKEILIDLINFGAEDLVNNSETNEEQNNDEMKKILYSKMVSFGFLTYYDGKISIPNTELKEKFIEVLKSNNYLKVFFDMIKNSDKMLKVTLEMKSKEMCEILENSHLKKIKPRDKMDHGNLKRVIDFAYFNAMTKYDIREEESNGKGDLEYSFYPRKKDETVIIIELKLNSSAENAINQIHKNNYYFGLKDKGYTGNILLVGINLNKNKKVYSCKIEEYDNELNFKNSNEYIPPKSEKKRKSEIKFDGIFKRLRSDTQQKKKKK